MFSFVILVLTSERSLTSSLRISSIASKLIEISPQVHVESFAHKFEHFEVSFLLYYCREPTKPVMMAACHCHDNDCFILWESSHDRNLTCCTV